MSFAADVTSCRARHRPTSRVRTEIRGCGAALHTNDVSKRIVAAWQTLLTSSLNPYVPTASGVKLARKCRGSETCGVGPSSGARECRYANPSTSRVATFAVSFPERNRRRHALDPGGADVSVHSYSKPSSGRCGTSQSGAEFHIAHSSSADNGRELGGGGAGGCGEPSLMMVTGAEDSGAEDSSPKTATPLIVASYDDLYA